jgi:hypothetical protein
MHCAVQLLPCALPEQFHAELSGKVGLVTLGWPAHALQQHELHDTGNCRPGLVFELTVDQKQGFL